MKQTQLETLLRDSRLVNPKSVEVDSRFKEQLRESLYEEYLSNISKENIFMKASKNLKLGWQVGLGAFSGLALIAYALIVQTGVLSPEPDIKGIGNISAAVTFIEGDAEYKKADAGWKDLEEGMTLSEGDSVRTFTDARAVLTLDNGSAVRLDANSEIAFTDMDPNHILISQESGYSYHRVITSDTSTHTVANGEVQARALGTAYSFDLTGEDCLVKVYESKVELSVGDSKEEIDTLYKGHCDEEKEEIVVEPLEEKEYTKDEFVTWNQENDKNEGYESPDKTPPVVTITSPKNGLKTEDGSVLITGKVTDADSGPRKITINGKVFRSSDGEFGFDPETGTFKVKLAIPVGKTVLKVTGYDYYWNYSTSSVTVTRTEPVVEEPVVKNYFYINGISSPASGKIALSWYMSGYSAPKGFKVVWAEHSSPTYPGSSYKYVSNPYQRELSFGGVPAGTYYVKVCVYTGGGCSYYTPAKKIVVSGAEAVNWADGIELYQIGDLTSFSVSEVIEPQIISGYRLKVGWSPYGGTAPDGYKICRSTSPNPTYPGSSCWYTSNTSYVWEDLAPGTTYYVRVGLYKSGTGVTLYSNQLTVTTP